MASGQPARMRRCSLFVETTGYRVGKDAGARPDDRTVQFARPDFDLRRTLVFTHVPKTTGTAFREALTKALSPRCHFAGFDASLHGDFVAFDTLADARRRNFVAGREALPRDANLVLGIWLSRTQRRPPPGQMRST